MPFPPPSSTETRRLAAILFTDMVGFSALTQRNEALALALLDEQHALVRPLLPNYQGREVKSTGDGYLIEFASALAAVQCAVAVQRTLAQRNAAEPVERQIIIRIGIHLGDLVEKDGDVFGDGVNIAARIEPRAEPGGICVSHAVRDQIANKVEWPLVALPALELKNIQSEIQLYRLVFDGSAPAEAPATKPSTPRRAVVLPAAALGGLALAGIGGAAFWRSRSSSRPASPHSTRPEAKSVAVLPFENLSSSKENEFLSDGITEELLTALARIPGLRVPARTSSFAFKGKSEDIRKIGELLSVRTVLEGSVRREGNRLKIKAQLVNVADGFSLWSETYDREMKSVFAIEEEIARTIVEKLKVTLSGEHLNGPIVKVPTENMEAWQLYLKGKFYSYRFTENDLKRSIDYFS